MVVAARCCLQNIATMAIALACLYVGINTFLQPQLTQYTLKPCRPRPHALLRSNNTTPTESLSMDIARDQGKLIRARVWNDFNLMTRLSH